MTEGTGFCSFPRDHEDLDSVGSGVAAPEARLHVCNPETGVVLSYGNPREHIGGAQVIDSCLGTHSDALFAEDGQMWLRTGDLVFIDERESVHLVGRYQAIINQGGHGIPCMEIEGEIKQLDAVQRCHVVGLDSGRPFGNDIAAVAQGDTSGVRQHVTNSGDRARSPKVLHLDHNPGLHKCVALVCRRGK